MAEFPDEVITACVEHYRRPADGHARFATSRRAGRSFPTDYAPMPHDLFGSDDEDACRAHVQRVIAELDEFGGIGRWPLLGRVRQGRQSAEADYRVFAGPSDADLAALPHIEEAWCLAEFICADCGLRSDTWTKVGLGRAHVRYGMLLDWSARDVAQRLARERDKYDRRRRLRPLRAGPRAGSDGTRRRAR